jgi:hypothetical protein
MSYKTEVFVDRQWSTNALRFATEKEAVDYGHELLSRWMAPTDSRATACEDPVNYRFNTEKWAAEPIKA